MPFVPGITKILERTGFRLLILAVLVGVVAGCGALFFYFATNSLEHIMLGKVANFHPPLEGTSADSFDFFIDSLSTHYRWFLFLIPGSWWSIFRLAGLYLCSRSRRTWYGWSPRSISPQGRHHSQPGSDS